ncbi:CDP-diacylglycerol--serine O-phosphatidyltransferase [Nonomuraea terrae]|uniref:CDP-diacylglycerol--serine O-phosphatidyltransferase n=1 Tax=Nonomuraea terrae TaxID=2530383 RepID=A0A4V2YIZ7_9ACTN|nr:CDP-diacylglycerol--serine O-phosphatidyltransferase [Nonomuraea terrae]TDD36887.1 CDP-diacylglycerol--serine O-phosphatidyltransferase [Nonomuraea terrae]
MTTADAGSWQAENEEPRGPVGKAFRLSAADSLSLGNAVCGFLAVCVLAYSAIQQLQVAPGRFTPDPSYFATAIVLLLIGATCDLFDGLVARRFRASAMGAELDNLADVISFGFAPAFMVVIWGMGFSDRVPFAAVLVAAAAVLVAGVVRLARFACVKTKSGDFMGLPIPMGAMSVISIVLLFQPSIWALVGVLGVAWLMVSRIEYPKPKGQLAAVVLGWIMVNVAFLTFWVAWPEGGDLPIKIGATMQIALVAAIPLRMLFYKREQRQYNKRREAEGVEHVSN